jgi:hypothetical protein
MKTILSLVLSYFLATSFAFGQARAPSTEDFVKKVAVSDMMEIETSSWPSINSLTPTQDHSQNA